MANDLENSFDIILKQQNKAPMVSKLQESRKQLAKINDIETVVNPRTGLIDMAELAKYGENAPLTGELRTAADFASEFKKESKSGSEPSRVNLYDAALAVSGHPALAAGRTAARLAGHGASSSGIFPRELPSYDVSGIRKSLPEILKSLGISSYVESEQPKK